MLIAYSPLMSAKQPTFQQRGYAMDAWQSYMSGISCS